MEINAITHKVIGKAIEVHKQLEPGLLESAYAHCLHKELIASGLHVQREVACPIIYKGDILDHGYRIDLLVENKIVIELKCVEAFTDVHKAQMITYLKLGKYPLGLLLNFHTLKLADGLRRFVNSRPSESCTAKSR